jgi:hypothetical protein
LSRVVVQVLDTHRQTHRRIADSKMGFTH